MTISAVVKDKHCVHIFGFSQNPDLTTITKCYKIPYTTDRLGNLSLTFVYSTVNMYLCDYYQCYMKKLILILSLILPICANAQIDSINYAVGYQTILGFLAGEIKFIQSEEDIRDLYRGIEENKPTIEEISDSAYTYNYVAGSIQGVFLLDSFEHTQEDELPPIKCIIKGLRMVADNKLNLPQDTIDAKTYISSFPDSINPVKLAYDERCRFFTAYGVLKGLAPGLKQLLNEYGYSHIKPNYQHYAQGFADMLEIFKIWGEEPKTAYDYGKVIALGMRNSLIEKQPLDKKDVLSEDYMAGIRAALGLEDAQLSRDEIDAIMERYFNSFEIADVVVTQLPDDSGGAEQIPLTVKSNEPYEVAWEFEAYTPMPSENCTAEINDAIFAVTSYLQSINIQTVPYSDDISQMIFTLDVDNSINYHITEKAISSIANEWYSEQPSYLKFFCGKDCNGKTIFGISNTTDIFISKIYGANIDSNRLITFYFGNDSTRNAEAERWARFTERNIGRIVVCELNDKIVMVPKVNAEITSGACAVSGLHLSNSYINNLFSTPVTTDEIEIIEIQ